MMTLVKTNERYHLPKRCVDELHRFMKKFYAEHPDFKPTFKVDSEKTKPVPDWWK